MDTAELNKEARKRYNILLGKIKNVCGKYINKDNNESNRNSLHSDICRVIDPYEREKYIDKYDLDCSVNMNPVSVIKNGEFCFFFGIIYKSKREGAKNTFKARSI